LEYIFETHLHTTEASACSRTPAVEYIEYMKSLGYSGIIVTDHFFSGNSCVPRNLPWEERVNMYCSGFEHAKNAAGDDLVVLFGIEYNFQGDEFMLYGLDKKWLLDNPDILQTDRYQLYERVHQAGGIMIQAHPFRERGYLSAIHLTPGVCDGVEVYNAANPDWQNALAYEYALDKDFRMAAGSDIHSVSQEDMGGMSFPFPIETIDDYVKAFMENEGTPVFRRNVHGQTGRFAPVSEETTLMVTLQEPTLEVFVH
jgi:hypothetical protein